MHTRTHTALRTKCAHPPTSPDGSYLHSYIGKANTATLLVKWPPRVEFQFRLRSRLNLHSLKVLSYVDVLSDHPSPCIPLILFPVREPQSLLLLAREPLHFLLSHSVAVTAPSF